MLLHGIYGFMHVFYRAKKNHAGAISLRHRMKPSKAKCELWSPFDDLVDMTPIMSEMPSLPEVRRPGPKSRVSGVYRYRFEPIFCSTPRKRLQFTLDTSRLDFEVIAEAMHKTSELSGMETIISYQDDTSEESSLDSSRLEFDGIWKATYSELSVKFIASKQ